MKKLIFVITTLLLVALGWYLFLKPSDFTISFKVETTPGTVIQSVKAWDLSLDNSKIIAQYNFDALVQQRSINGSTVNYTYRFYAVNDSTTKVSVGIKDLDNSIYNKLTIPFANTDFEKKSAEEINAFYTILKQHLSELKIKITGIENTPSTYCAYIPLKGLQIEKAKGMMQNYGYIGDILAAGNVTFNGPPFVEITNWDIKTDSISYNFCFPIIKSDSLPQAKDIRYKQLQKTEAIHAVYNGNYITSDRAWYALMAYAKRNNIAIEQKPLEVFFNNPNMGGNELDWKADIYMPLKKDTLN